MNFEVIIDYKNIFENNEGLGSGVRGTIYKYHGNIIKLQYCKNLNYNLKYSERTNIYKLTQDDTNQIEYYKKLASVVNNLPHFIKIKGYLICPNLNGGGGPFINCIYRSIIYENAGKLTRKKYLPFNKQNALQLLDILKSFKKFNLAGWFHEDIQGCNNIEPNQFNNLYVIDYENLVCVNNNRVRLKDIKIDIYKMITCILSYTTGKVTTDNLIIGFEIDLIILQKYLERKPISYKEPDFSNKQIANIIIKGGIIYTQEDSYSIQKSVIPEINDSIDECVKILESIENIRVNICEFIFLMENSIKNYFTIMNFISNIKDYLDPIDHFNIHELINNVVKIIITKFYNYGLCFYFDDIKYIIESVYNKYIFSYENFYIKN